MKNTSKKSKIAKEGDEGIKDTKNAEAVDGSKACDIIELSIPHNQLKVIEKYAKRAQKSVNDYIYDAICLAVGIDDAIERDLGEEGIKAGRSSYKELSFFE